MWNQNFKEREGEGEREGGGGGGVAYRFVVHVFTITPQDVTFPGEVHVTLLWFNLISPYD